MQDFILFGIDLQNAFGLQRHPLCVPGAPEDMQRIAGLITENVANIRDIVLTMDTHETNHIGHPGWWRTAEGAEPAPFTLVTPEKLASGEIRAADPDKQEHAVEYVQALKAVMIWPVHCVPDTESYELVQGVESAVMDWELATENQATVVKKGFQRDVEAFGVFAAEYQDGSLGSDFNEHLLANLTYRGLPIVVVGEALSHCVRRSVEQLVGGLKARQLATKVILVRDCTSPVPGFDADVEAFLGFCAANGVQVCTAAELPEVLA